MIEPSQAGNAFVASAPAEKRQTLQAARELILSSLPAGYEERVSGKSLAYIVPHELFPAGYHCDPKQPLGAAWLMLNAKGLSLHMMTIYGDSKAESRIREAYAKAGKKLDMGKACIRFDSVDKLETGVIAETLGALTPQAWIEKYEQALRGRASSKAAG